MTTQSVCDLGLGGRSLWDDINAAHSDLDAGQKVQLLEACRAKDRCDDLNVMILGRPDGWEKLLDKANTTATLMKQMLAAMRLPDGVTGKKPQVRGTARGSQRPTIPGGTVSSLERARAKAGA